MPSLWPAGDTGQNFSIPGYNEPADVVAAFQSYSTQLTTMLPPIGSILPFVGKVAPAGWLICNGASYKTASYPTLAALMGATADSFNVPNLVGRTIVGVDPSKPAMDNPLDTGGAGEVTLLEENLAKHKHAIGGHVHGLTGTVTVADATAAHSHTGSAKSAGAHQHNTGYTTKGGQGTSGSSIPVNDAQNSDKTGNGGDHVHDLTVNSGNASHGHAVTNTLAVGEASGDTAETGSGKAFSVLNPYMALNWIVRAN